MNNVRAREHDMAWYRVDFSQQARTAVCERLECVIISDRWRCDRSAQPSPSCLHSSLFVRVPVVRPFSSGSRPVRVVCIYFLQPYEFYNLNQSFSVSRVYHTSTIIILLYYKDYSPVLLFVMLCRYTRCISLNPYCRITGSIWNSVQICLMNRF